MTGWRIQEAQVTANRHSQRFALCVLSDWHQSLPAVRIFGRASSLCPEALKTRPSINCLYDRFIVQNITTAKICCFVTLIVLGIQKEESLQFKLFLLGQPLPHLLETCTMFPRYSGFEIGQPQGLKTVDEELQEQDCNSTRKKKNKSCCTFCEGGS